MCTISPDRVTFTMSTEKDKNTPDASGKETGAEEAGAAPKGESPTKKKFLGIPGIPAPKKIMKKEAGDAPEGEDPTKKGFFDFMKKKPEPEVPNLLWKRIEAKDWDEVTAVLEGDDDIAEMVTKWHKENLPLHASCKSGKASDEIVLKILGAYPDAAARRGKNGMLPLQLAINHKRGYNVIRSLILAYPDALDARIDDKNPVRLETTRTWIDFQGHPADVKRLIQKPVADWKVIQKYEIEKDDQHDKIVRLEKRLKTAKKKHDQADKASKSLAERVEELEAAHHRMSISIGAEIEEKERIMKERLAELKVKFQAYMEMQEAKNNEFLYDLATAKHREAVSSAVLEMKKDELIGFFKKSLEDAEHLKKLIWARS